jgi:hypothetical protein
MVVMVVVLVVLVVVNDNFVMTKENKKKQQASPFFLYIKTYITKVYISKSNLTHTRTHFGEL